MFTLLKIWTIVIFITIKFFTTIGNPLLTTEPKSIRTNKIIAKPLMYK